MQCECVAIHGAAMVAQVIECAFKESILYQDTIAEVWDDFKEHFSK